MSITTNYIKLGTSVDCFFPAGAGNPSYSVDGKAVSDISTNVDYLVFNLTGAVPASAQLQLPAKSGNYAFVSNFTGTSVTIYCGSNINNAVTLTNAECAALYCNGSVYQKVSVSSASIDIGSYSATTNIDNSSLFLVKLSDGSTHSVSFATLKSMLGVSSTSGIIMAKCATTGNITLSGLQTIDGQVILEGDTALVKNQTIPTQNGVWIASANTWQRSAQMQVGNSASVILIASQFGAINRGLWISQNAAGYDIIGTDSLTWVNLSVSVVAGNNITIDSSNVITAKSASASVPGVVPATGTLVSGISPNAGEAPVVQTDGSLNYGAVVQSVVPAESSATVIPAAIGSSASSPSIGLYVDNGTIVNNAGVASVGLITSTNITNGTIVSADISSTAGITDGQLATAYIKSDGSRSFAGSQSMNGFSLTNLATPANASDAANKTYVDSIAQGLRLKGLATYVATANISALSGTVANPDGYVVVSGDIVLCTAQTNAVNNGPWVVVSGGDWVRPTNFAAGSPASGGYWFVDKGTTYHDTGWACSTDSGSDVVGANLLAIFEQSAAGVVGADGTTLTKSGNILSISSAFQSIINSAIQTIGTKTASPTVGAITVADATTERDIGVTTDGTTISGVGGLHIVDGSVTLSKMDTTGAVGTALAGTGAGAAPTWTNALTLGAVGGTVSANGANQGRLSATNGGSIVVCIGPSPDYPTSFAGLWIGSSANNPNGSNYSFLNSLDGANTYFNANTTLWFGTGNNYRVKVASTQTQIGFPLQVCPAALSTNNTPVAALQPVNTSATAGANIYSTTDGAVYLNSLCAPSALTTSTNYTIATQGTINLTTTLNAPYGAGAGTVSLTVAINTITNVTVFQGTPTQSTVYGGGFSALTASSTLTTLNSGNATWMYATSTIGTISLPHQYLGGLSSVLGTSASPFTGTTAAALWSAHSATAGTPMLYHAVNQVASNITTSTGCSVYTARPIRSGVWAVQFTIAATTATAITVKMFELNSTVNAADGVIKIRLHPISASTSYAALQDSINFTAEFNGGMSILADTSAALTLNKPVATTGSTSTNGLRIWLGGRHDGTSEGFGQTGTYSALPYVYAENVTTSVSSGVCSFTFTPVACAVGRVCRFEIEASLIETGLSTT